MLLISNASDSQMDSTSAWCLNRARHRDVRNHKTIVSGCGYADPPSVEEKFKSVHGFKGLTILLVGKNFY
jgi:hypothetical protein